MKDSEATLEGLWVQSLGCIRDVLAMASAEEVLWHIIGTHEQQPEHASMSRAIASQCTRKLAEPWSSCQGCVGTLRDHTLCESLPKSATLSMKPGEWTTTP